MFTNITDGQTDDVFERISECDMHTWHAALINLILLATTVLIAVCIVSQIDPSSFIFLANRASLTRQAFTRAVKPAFHDTNTYTDILATILARMSASVSWNAAFKALYCTHTARAERVRQDDGGGGAPSCCSCFDLSPTASS